MAIRCPKCQFENPDDTIYCGKCAASLQPSEEIPESPTKTIEAPKEELTTGSTFAGRYQIIEELGKGGMGKVYKANDTEIKEKVAVKLIKPEIAADKKTIERFQNELKFSRKISHRNVCRMYDLNKEEASYYITMEYVEGEDLKSTIRRVGPLGTGKAISIAKQVCNGLIEAHRLGVVHRDLKPGNIMIDKEGNARIMDFGIARSLSGKGITGAGVMIGTPEYMSPEQVEGKEVDQRSDIYSLGVILYEMVTGRVPFEGDTPFAIGMKHKSEIPKNPKEINTQLPDDLSRVILRCLEKDKSNRYQSAGEVRAELENMEKGIPTTEKVIPKRKPLTSKEITLMFRLKKLFIPVLAVVVIAVAAVIIWQKLPQRQASIAVLPFTNMNADPEQEYLCDGITENLISKLSQLPSLKKVIAWSSVSSYKGKEINSKAVGQKLNVDSVLIGRLGQRGDEMSLSVELVRTVDNSHIWGDKYTRKESEILDLQEEISNAIVDRLRLKLTGEELKRIAKRHTENTEAYQAYLKGRYFWNKRTEGDLKKAIEFFEEAIEKDPKYALAYTGLADCYNLLSYYSNVPSSKSFPKAKEAALKAISIDETLGEAHNSLAYGTYRYYWNFVEGERRFKRAIELNPNYATARFWYGEFLMTQGRFDEAFKQANLALELNPISLIINTYLGSLYNRARKAEKAVPQLLKTIDMDPNFAMAHNRLCLAYAYLNRFPEAIAEGKKAVEISGCSSLYVSHLGWIYAQAGEYEEAKNILEELQKLSKEQYVSPYFIALVYAGLEDNDKAFDWLEKAYDERHEFLIAIKVSRTLDPIRTDPRFSELLKKIGLEE